MKISVFCKNPNSTSKGPAFAKQLGITKPLKIINVKENFRFKLISLFRNKNFVLDEIFQQIFSKFVFSQRYSTFWSIHWNISKPSSSIYKRVISKKDSMILCILFHNYQNIPHCSNMVLVQIFFLHCCTWYHWALELSHFCPEIFLRLKY